MYYAFYGSLRRGLENYLIYADHLEYQFSCRIDGFKLYSLGDYPCAIQTALPESSIVVEVFEVKSTDISKEIDLMEIDAGYYMDTISVNGIEASIFLFKDAVKLREVVGGDWLKYIENGLF